MRKIALIAALLPLYPAAAQVITPAPTSTPISTQSNGLSDMQAQSLSAEAKQATGKSCNLAPKKALWSQKALAATPNAPLQVTEQFLAALEKLTSDYSTVVKLGHTQSGKWALVRDRDNFTNIYFAVSQNNGQMVVKFCELQ